jgi:hypothetical protein
VDDGFFVFTRSAPAAGVWRRTRGAAQKVACARLLLRAQRRCSHAGYSSAPWSYGLSFRVWLALLGALAGRALVVLIWHLWGKLKLETELSELVGQLARYSTWLAS